MVLDCVKYGSRAHTIALSICGPSVVATLVRFESACDCIDHMR